MAVDSDWLDDESMEDDGVFYDPDTGQYYAKLDYTYKGGKSGIGKSSKFGKRKTKKGRTYVELAEDEIEEFKKFREGNEGKAFRGKRGSGAYGGPGREIRKTQFRMQRDDETSAQYKAAKQEFERNYANQTSKRIENLQKKSNWWDKERASGERGTKRKELIQAQANAIQAFRARFDAGTGWG